MSSYSSHSISPKGAKKSVEVQNLDKTVIPSKRLRTELISRKWALLCCTTTYILLASLLIINNCDTSSALQQQSSTNSGGLNLSLGDTQDGPPAKKCNDERHAEMDKCASNLGFLGDRTFVMPKNVSQMDGFCATLTKSLKCIQNYARECLSSFPRQVLLTVTRNGRKQYNQLCANSQTKQEFMDKLTCLAPENLEQLHQCMDGSIARFEYVANRVEADNRISAICCSYQIFKKDIQETVEKSCVAYPNVNQTAHYLHEIISTTTGARDAERDMPSGDIDRRSRKGVKDKGVDDKDETLGVARDKDNILT